MFVDNRIRHPGTKSVPERYRVRRHDEGSLRAIYGTLNVGTGKPIRHDSTEDNETCSRSLKDWREALPIKAELCSRTAAAGESMKQDHHESRRGGPSETVHLIGVFV